MATKSQIRTFAKLNNVTMAAAKLHFLTNAIDGKMNRADELASMVPAKFYNAPELTNDVSGAMLVQTPEGLSKFANAVTGIEFYEGDNDMPTWAGTSGYGMSYATQKTANSSVKRSARAAFMTTTGDLLQVTFTLVDNSLTDMDLLTVVATIATRMGLTQFAGVRMAQETVESFDNMFAGAVGINTVPDYINDNNAIALAA